MKFIDFVVLQNDSIIWDHHSQYVNSVDLMICANYMMTGISACSSGIRGVENVCR